jgi:hypothetical protein
VFFSVSAFVNATVCLQETEGDMKRMALVILLFCCGQHTSGEKNSSVPDAVLRYELSLVKPEYHWVIHKDPAGYIQNKAKLTEAGMSEEDAINLLFQRAVENLQKQDEKKKREKILADIEHLPPMQKRMALQDVDMYIQRRKAFEYSGSSSSERELWLLGLKRTKDGKILTPHGAPSSFMEEELKNAQNREELKLEVSRIIYIRKWLSYYAPPTTIPVSNQKHSDLTLPLAVRLVAAKAERQELQRYSRYYAEQLKQREEQRQQYEELMDRINELENQIRNQDTSKPPLNMRF